MRRARVKAFLLGVWEFRSDLTTSFDETDEGYSLLCCYDAGRDLAHQLTGRRWDSN